MFPDMNPFLTRGKQYSRNAGYVARMQGQMFKPGPGCIDFYLRQVIDFS